MYAFPSVLFSACVCTQAKGNAAGTGPPRRTPSVAPTSARVSCS